MEAVGFQVFLPQRDGVERNKTPYDEMTPERRRLSMFQLGEQRSSSRTCFLFVQDERVPDEGACTELGIAYCQKKLHAPGKLLVGLRTDVRAAFLGSGLNPMLRVPLEFLQSRRDLGGISG